jgi:hypothetical protein
MMILRAILLIPEEFNQLKVPLREQGLFFINEFVVPNQNSINQL